MVNLVPALAGVVMTIGLVGMAGTNIAFAQQPSCGEAPYGYIGCTPLGTAQTYGAIMAGALMAFAVAWGVQGRKYHTIP